MNCKHEREKKYAELGRLSINAINKFSLESIDSQPCASSNNNYLQCADDECSWYDFCQKRAEILEGENELSEWELTRITEYVQQQINEQDKVYTAWDILMSKLRDYE